MDRRLNSRALLLCLAVAIAAYVRISHPELTWFTLDQARDAQVALGIVSGRALPLLGVEVEGGPAHTWGPAYFYLVAMLFALSRDPAFAVAVLSAASVATIILIERFGRAFFGPPVGLLSAFLVAAYPFAVIDARALSNLALVPIFTIVFVFALFSAIIRGRSIMIIAALGALALLVQLHLSTVSLIVLLLVACVLFRPPLRAIHVGIGLSLGLLLMLPYLVAQVLSRFEDVRALFPYARGQVRARTPRALADLAGRVLFASPDIVRGLMGIPETWRSDAFFVLHAIEAWLLALGLAYVGVALAWRSLRPRARDGTERAFALLALWVVIPFAMLGAKAQARLQYFGVIYPAPFIAASLLLVRGIAWGEAAGGVLARRGLWSVVVMFVALTVAAQIDFHRQWWRAIQTMGAIVWSPGPSSPPLEVMPIADQARLARTLVEEFGLDSVDAFRRVHGSRARDLLEDKGYFLEQASAAPPRRGAAARDQTVHYAIVRDEGSPVPAPGQRLARAGPYTVVEYRPLIDYARWRCREGGSEGPGESRPERVDDWAPVGLPTAELPPPAAYGLAPHRAWHSPVVSCRGSLQVTGPLPERLLVIVSLRATAPGDPRVETFRLNGTDISPSRMLAHSSMIANSIDALFDVGPHVREGANEILLDISSRTSRFDLDVYEIRD